MRQMLLWKRRFYQWLANSMPKQLIYFTTVRGVAIATTGIYVSTNPNDLNAMEILKRVDQLTNANGQR